MGMAHPQEMHYDLVEYSFALDLEQADTIANLLIGVYPA